MTRAGAGLLTMLLALGLSACKLTPDYERPELDLPQDYVEPTSEGESIANLPWWELFGEPELNDLILTALAENKDLAIAIRRIDEAEAIVRFVRADQYPFLDADAAAGRERLSEDFNPLGGTNNDFSIAGRLSFEVDLWGKLRRATEAAQSELLATEAARRSVTISLVAAVASTYLSLRDLDERRAISDATLESREESLRIIQARFDRGTVSELELNQAQIEAADAAAALAAFERLDRQTENALRVLIGANPGPIVRGRALEELATPPEVPAGLPAELIERRPDVIAAEQQLAAQTARIGVARAARFPSLSLTGAFGWESEELHDLLDGPTKQWNLFGNLFAPIFNWGKLKAQEEVERARAEEALLAYEATILDAFREVEDALVAIRTFEAEHAARLRQLTAARNAAVLSWERWDGGIVSYIEVLDSERSRFDAELLVSATRQARLDAVVQLYKALGGGWTTELGANPAVENAP